MPNAEDLLGLPADRGAVDALESSTLAQELSKQLHRRRGLIRETLHKNTLRIETPLQGIAALRVVVDVEANNGGRSLQHHGVSTSSAPPHGARTARPQLSRHTPCMFARQTKN